MADNEEKPLLATAEEEQRFRKLTAKGGGHELSEEDVADTIRSHEMKRSFRTVKRWVKEQSIWLSGVLAFFYVIKDHIIAFLEGLSK